jgi:hypothetical protein
MKSAPEAQQFAFKFSNPTDDATYNFRWSFAHIGSYGACSGTVTPSTRIATGTFGCWKHDSSAAPHPPFANTGDYRSSASIFWPQAETRLESEANGGLRGRERAYRE